MKKSNTLLFFILFFLSLCFILLDQNRKLKTARVVSFSLAFPINKSITFLENIFSVYKENQRLTSIATKLALENARLYEYKFENEQLRPLLEFKREGIFNLLPCEIIGRDVGGPIRTLTIDKGFKDGIETGMSVVSYQGLIGKVIEAFPNAASVQTILDRGCKVGSIVKRTGVCGILESKGAYDLFLNFVPKESNISLNDEIVASDIGGIFPGGLKIGVVKEIGEEYMGLFKKIRVKPYVNFPKINFVFVVLGRSEEKLFTKEEKKLIRTIEAESLEIPPFVEEITE